MPVTPSAGPAPAIADDLTAQGWSQHDHFLPDDLTLALAAQCRALSQAGALQPSAVGRGAGQAVRHSIRGDRIGWLSEGQSAAVDRYLAIMDSLRLNLNRSLFLGLEDYESHFACYAPGAAYSRHLDRFRDDDRRTVSVVIYLNADWLPEHGGALRLYPPDQAARDVLPLGGRLALFLSAEMPHEVLPATRERLSLAGWFRRR
ncbi:MAG: 2OG-Fe(II) oxygenase [Pseudomonadota bacterium]